MGKIFTISYYETEITNTHPLRGIANDPRQMRPATIGTLSIRSRRTRSPYIQMEKMISNKISTKQKCKIAY